MPGRHLAGVFSSSNVAGDVLHRTGLDIKQEGTMNELLKHGSHSDYAQRNGLTVKNFGRHNGTTGRKKDSFSSFERNVIAASVEEQQENSFDRRKYSKASSYRKTRNRHDRLTPALGDHGAVSGGIEKYVTDLVPDIYDEIFRLPPKISSSSKFSELPVLDPSAYYDEEDLFSTTTVIRNSAAGVIYEDIFGGGLASGPSYTDLSELLDYFGVCNSRSGTSSSSGLYVESPNPAPNSFKGEGDDNGELFSNDPSMLESSAERPTQLQNRSVNSSSRADVAEECYIGLNKEHVTVPNKRGSRRFSKNDEEQKERRNDVARQAFTVPAYIETSFPVSIDVDPTLQSSCSNNFSELISHEKTYSSHDYTKDWLKSIAGFKDRSENTKATDNDKKDISSFNQGVNIEDRHLSLEMHESIKSGEMQTVTDGKRQNDKRHEDVWLTIDKLKLKTIPSVTPPPSRLPPMPRDIPSAVPVLMPDWHAPGNGNVHGKPHENGIGKEMQELTSSDPPDLSTNFPVPLVHNEAGRCKVSSLKEEKLPETDAVSCMGENDNVLTPIDPDNLVTNCKAEERLIGILKSGERGERAHQSDVEDKVLNMQQKTSLMGSTVSAHFRGAEQHGRKKIAVESLDQNHVNHIVKTMCVTGADYLSEINEGKPTTFSLGDLEHREVTIGIPQVSGVEKTEAETVVAATSKNLVSSSKDNKEREVMMDAPVVDGIELKARVRLVSGNSETKEEDVVILGADGVYCTKKVIQKVESGISKLNKEISASKPENVAVHFTPEAGAMRNQTMDIMDREGNHSMWLKKENKKNRLSILEATVTKPELATMKKKIVHRERINKVEKERDDVSILELKRGVTQRELEMEEKAGDEKGGHRLQMHEEEKKEERFSILEEILIPPFMGGVLESQIREEKANIMLQEKLKSTQMDSVVIEKQSNYEMRPEEEEKKMNQCSPLEVRERVTHSEVEMKKQAGYRASDLSMRLNAKENDRQNCSIIEERQEPTDSETVEKQSSTRPGGYLSMRSNKENMTNKLGTKRAKLIRGSEVMLESEIVEGMNADHKGGGMSEARATVIQPKSEIVETQMSQSGADIEEDSKRFHSSVGEGSDRMLPTKPELDAMEKESRIREGNLNVSQNEGIKRNESINFKLAKERPSQPESETMEKQTNDREGDLKDILNGKENKRNESSILEVREGVGQPKSEMIEKQPLYGEGYLPMSPGENERNKSSIHDVRKRVTRQGSETTMKSAGHADSEVCIEQKEEEIKRKRLTALEENERIIMLESEVMETQSRHKEGGRSLSLNEDKGNTPSILDPKETVTQPVPKEMDKHIRHTEGGLHNWGVKATPFEIKVTVTQTESELMDKQNVHRAGDSSVGLNEDHKGNQTGVYEAKESETQPELEVLDKPSKNREDDFNPNPFEEDKRSNFKPSGARERTIQPNSNAEFFDAKHKKAKEVDAVDVNNKKEVPDKMFTNPLENKDWDVREIEIDIRRRERIYESERQKEREMEREKDRMGLGNTFFDFLEKSCEQKANLEKMAVNPRERTGRTPMEMAGSVSREKVLERAERAVAEKVAASRDKAGLAAAERSQVDTNGRVSQRGIAEKVAAEGCEQTEKAMSIKEQNRKTLNETGQPTTSSSCFMPKASNDILRGTRRMGDNRSSLSGTDAKIHELGFVASESHRRTLERVAKALAEKKQRDLEVQREFAEKERMAGSIDLELKRWSTGKEGNLRALLSTLHYVLWRESGWQTVSLTEIVTSAAVKKAYRKATLCVHPDKVQQKGATIRQKYIAEKVFDLLKEAWNKFNIEEQK